MNIPLVDLPRQYGTLEPEALAAVSALLRSGRYILGPAVADFEAAFARHCDADHCVGVASGTDALHLALRAVGVGPGDEVVTAANTFIATALAIAQTGATPVLVDALPGRLTVDVDLLAAAITERTRAIVPVHLFGQMCDMDAVMALARDRGLAVVEDACQAHGARWRGRRAGSMGDVGCFSFYPAKNLGACGDGGAAITSNAALAEKVRLLRNYGAPRKYEHVVMGYNSRLDALQAVLLAVKLPRLDGWNEQRRQAAAVYGELLGQLPLELPVPAAGSEDVFHLYVVRTPQRDRLAGHLKQAGVETGVHYPIPIHLQEAFAALPYGRGSFPVTERAADTMLSLPLFPEITRQEQEQVAAAIAASLAPASANG